MNITAATLMNIQGHLVLELVTPEGRGYVDEPKPKILAWGFVILGGPDLDKLDTQTSTLPMDPADGIWEPMQFEHTTRDAVAVELARMLSAGELREPGPIELPSFEEADGKLWRLVDGGLQRIN